MRKGRVSTVIGFIIITVTAIVIFGGVMVYQYYFVPREARVPGVFTSPALLSFNIIPSDKSEQGIVYLTGAEAVLKANNLSRVEFRQRGGGTGIYTSPEGGLVASGLKNKRR